MLNPKKQKVESRGLTSVFFGERLVSQSHYPQTPGEVTGLEKAYRAALLLQMVKRHYSAPHSEDEWNEQDDVSSLFSSPDNKRKEQKSNRVSLPRNVAARKKRRLGNQAQETTIQSGIIAVRDSSHSRTLHLIRSPGPMRTALLKWFATVRDSRGMPWRKSFKLSQDPEQRSQRAYEVMRTLILNVFGEI